MGPHAGLVAVELPLEPQARSHEGGSDQPDQDVELERDLSRQANSPRQVRDMSAARSDPDRRSVVAGRKRPAGGGNNGEISAARHSPFAEIVGGTPPLVAPGPRT